MREVVGTTYCRFGRCVSGSAWRPCGSSLGSELEDFEGVLDSDKEALMKKEQRKHATGGGRNFACRVWSMFWTRCSQIVAILCISGGYQDFPPGFCTVLILSVSLDLEDSDKKTCQNPNR